MPTSVRDQFLVEVIRVPKDSTRSSKEIKDYPRYGCATLQLPAQTKTAKYVCVEDGESFMVSIETSNRYDDTTYGAVLYVDGKKVFGKKTFRNRALFQGFKLGRGSYKSFNFKTNDLAAAPET
jgi:hypothetical protein